MSDAPAAAVAASPRAASPPAPYWTTTPLRGMSRAQWEALCDGCGRCCLHKLRDEDTGALAHTEVACRLLDTATARCRDYANRKARVPDCVRLTPARLARVDWLPPTCAYAILRDGPRDLPPWHPLVSGDPASVRRAGVSVAGRAVGERVAGALEDHVVDWPGAWPREAARAPVPAAVEARPRVAIRRVSAAAAAAKRLVGGEAA